MTHTAVAADEPERPHVMRWADLTTTTTLRAADVLDLAAEVGVTATPEQVARLRTRFGEPDPYRTTAWVDRPKAIEAP